MWRNRLEEALDLSFDRLLMMMMMMMMILCLSVILVDGYKKQPIHFGFVSSICVLETLLNLLAIKTYLSIPIVRKCIISKLSMFASEIIQ